MPAMRCKNARTWIGAALAASLFAGSSGCTKLPSWTPKTEKAKPAPLAEKPPSGPTQVVVDGPALALGRPEQGAQARERFLAKFADLVREERAAAAAALVRRNPDLALETLRDGAPDHEDVLSALAAAYDAFAVVAGPGFQSALSEKRGVNEAAACKQARTLAAMHLRNGEFAAAAKIDVVEPARRSGRPMLLVDALQFAGVVRLLADEPRPAAALLEEAARLAGPHAPHQAVHALLLASEARRRAEDHAGADQLWTNAVVVAADLFAQSQPLVDPTFWDRAMYLQPVGLSWPQPVTARLLELPGKPGLPAPLRMLAEVVSASRRSPEDLSTGALLHALVGFHRLDRGEPQAGLVAVKRAESGLTPPTALAWCRLAEARALDAMDQAPAATAVLMQLASKNDAGAASRAALAELGSLKVRQGSTLQGAALLKQALESQPPMDWPGRAAAEADIGLALLIAGDERGGLASLKRAQARFEADGDMAALAQSLWNEARYFEQVDKKKHERQVADLDARRNVLRF